MKLLCSIDGEITPPTEGRVGVTDDGLLRGDGAFEMLRLYGGRPFALCDHLDRLDGSAAGIFLEYDRALFEREIHALLEANQLEHCYLRLVITRGGRRIAIIEAPKKFGETTTLSSVTYQTTIVLNGLKTLSYEANMTATRLAQRDNADEALLVRPDGIVMEAPTSTVFFVDSDGTVHTPELEVGVLASITRDRILQTLPVTTGDYQLSQLVSAKEIFLASSLREVQGVRELDGLTYEAPGPVTQRVAGLLSERIQAEMDEAE